MDTNIERIMNQTQRQPSPFRALTLVSFGTARPDWEKIRRLQDSDQLPRVLLYEQELNSDILDECYLEKAPRILRLIYGFFPPTVRQVLEAYRVRKNYDVIITWATRLSLAFALLLKITRTRTPHVAMCSWISTGNKAKLLRFVHTYIDRLVLWSTVQRDVAVNRLGVPESRITFVSRRVDHLFWRPMEKETDMICSAGAEMRDFPTLVEALRGLPIRCHIATGDLRGRQYETVRAVEAMGDLPENVTLGLKTPAELRELYARSRFVVVPLRPTDTDNGVTTIEEAMAMGKPVICTRTEGQRDMIEEGATGIYVPPREPKALRDAILALWNDPERARRMGKEARRFIEENHTLDRFLAQVKKTVEEVVNERRSDGQR